jgi:hypothetical protein
MNTIERVYYDAMNASKPMIIEVEGEPATMGETPDHDMRVKAAKEYAKFRGYNAPEVITINGGRSLLDSLIKD